MWIRLLSLLENLLFQSTVPGLNRSITLRRICPSFKSLIRLFTYTSSMPCELIQFLKILIYLVSSVSCYGGRSTILSPAPYNPCRWLKISKQKIVFNRVLPLRMSWGVTFVMIFCFRHVEITISALSFLFLLQNDWSRCATFVRTCPYA
jgi:hypothetical protein